MGELNERKKEKTRAYLCPRVGIRLRELRREDWRAVCPFRGSQLSAKERGKFSVHPVLSRTSTRESDHGLPGLAVKNETDASSLGEVCFLIATFVQRMRPRRILLIIKILKSCIGKIGTDPRQPLSALTRCSASLRLPPSLPVDFATLHPFRAAFGRLPSQRPLACVLSLYLLRPDLDFVFSRLQPGEGACSGIRWIAGLAEVIGVDLHRRAVGICKGGL